MINDNNAGNQIRIDEINRIRSKLERLVDIRRNIYYKYKKFYNILHGISITGTSLAAITSTVSIGMIANPIVVLPLGITSVILAGFGVVSGVFSKKISNKVRKHEKLLLLNSNTLANINKLFSESLKDGYVSNKEFKDIIEMYQTYLLNFKSTKDLFSDKYLIATNNINSEIKDALIIK